MASQTMVDVQEWYSNQAEAIMKDVHWTSTKEKGGNHNVKQSEVFLPTQLMRDRCIWRVTLDHSLRSKMNHTLATWKMSPDLFICRLAIKEMLILAKCHSLFIYGVVSERHQGSGRSMWWSPHYSVQSKLLDYNLTLQLNSVAKHNAHGKTLTGSLESCCEVCYWRLSNIT